MEVWSKKIRLFHWLFAIFIAIEYFSDDDQLMLIHEYIGYMLVLLIFFRIYIGFWGKKYELFTNSYSFKYTKNWLGHNIAASFVLGFMQILVISITISGLFLLGATEFEGVLSHYLIDITPQTSDTILQIHKITTNILLILIGLHLSGLFIAQFIHKENTILSMFNGKKEKYL